MEEAANVLFRIGPLEVTSTVTTMWAIIAVLGLISFLATRNLKEIPGPLQTGAEMAVGALRNAVPTACLSVTAGLGVVAFFTTHVIGAKERGLGPYLHSFANVKPALLVILMLPLNLIEQVIRPVSLALRLYGNLYGEETVTEQLYEIFPIGAPLIMQVLSLLFCLLQAIVFTMLLSIYISEGLEEE